MGSIPEWEAIGNDLDPAVILLVGVADVEVIDSGVGGDSGSGFPTDASCCSFQRPRTAAEDPGLGAGCTVVAKGVQNATAPAGAGGQGEW